MKTQYYLFIHQNPIEELTEDMILIEDEKEKKEKEGEDEKEKEKNYEVGMIMCYVTTGKNWNVEIRGSSELVKEFLKSSKKGNIHWDEFLQKKKLYMIPTHKDMIATIMEERDQNNGDWKHYILKNDKSSS